MSGAEQVRKCVDQELGSLFEVSEFLCIGCQRVRTITHSIQPLSSICQPTWSPKQRIDTVPTLSACTRVLTVPYI